MTDESSAPKPCNSSNKRHKYSGDDGYVFVRRFFSFSRSFLFCSRLCRCDKKIHQRMTTQSVGMTVHLYRSLLLAMLHTLVQLPLFVAHHHLVHVLFANNSRLIFLYADLLTCLPSLLFRTFRSPHLLPLPRVQQRAGPLRPLQPQLP